MKKKILSLILGICLIVSAIPIVTNASEDVELGLKITVAEPVVGQKTTLPSYRVLNASNDSLVLQTSLTDWYYADTDYNFNHDTLYKWHDQRDSAFNSEAFYGYVIAFGIPNKSQWKWEQWKNNTTINGQPCDDFTYDSVNGLITFYYKYGKAINDSSLPSEPSPLPESSTSPEPSVSPTSSASPDVSPSAEPIFPLTFKLENYTVDGGIVQGTYIYGDESNDDYIKLRSTAFTKVLSTKDSYQNDVITNDAATFDAAQDYYLAVSFIFNNGYSINNFSPDSITLDGYGTAMSLFENGTNGYTAVFKLPKLYREINSLNFTLNGYEIGQTLVGTTITSDLNNEGISWVDNSYLTHYSISDTEITIDNYEDNFIDADEYVFEKDTDYYLCITVPSVYGYTAENLTAENVTIEGIGSASSLVYLDEGEEEEGVNGLVAIFKLPQLKEVTPEPSVTPEPTAEPTAEPAAEPTATPEHSVIVTPTPTPTQSPTPEPTSVPSGYSGGGSSGTSTGSTEKSTVVASASPASTPATGDNSNMGIWFAVLAVSALGILGTSLIAKGKRK